MSEKIAALIEEIKALTVIELSELVKAIEEEFGVSAAAPVAVAGVAAPGAAGYGCGACGGDHPVIHPGQRSQPDGCKD